jgi:hypothetical protein
MARAQWGAVINALPHPIQVVVRGVQATTLPVVDRIEAIGSEEARDLAAWFGAHMHGEQLVERERFLCVPASDLETLGDRCASLEAAMRRIGLPLERISDEDRATRCRERLPDTEAAAIRTSRGGHFRQRPPGGGRFAHSRVRSWQAAAIDHH